MHVEGCHVMSRAAMHVLSRAAMHMLLLLLPLLLQITVLRPALWLILQTFRACNALPACNVLFPLQTVHVWPSKL